MTNTTAIDALIENITERPDVAPFTEVEDISTFSQQEIDLIQKAFHGSLDAAMALHNAVLPGWDWRIEDNVSGCVCQIGPAREEFTASIRAVSFDNPARAWLLAILRAMLTQK